MSDQRWKPNVTVATIVEDKGNYLLAHEAPEGHNVYNQPAGHLDEGESLIAAAERETLEETGYEVRVTDYLGMYRYIAPNGITYLRHGFVASLVKHHADFQLDKGIIDAVWMSYEDVCANNNQMRSPMVKQLIDDYRSNKHYPLAVIHEDR